MSKIEFPQIARNTTAKATARVRTKIAKVAFLALFTFVSLGLVAQALPLQPNDAGPSIPSLKVRSVGPSCSSYNTNLNAKPAEKATFSKESYTNHWDNLLLEEHNLAIEEWKERRRKSSIQTLERHGLAISRAFALPDSELLGEKTVRIHDGSGGKRSNRFLDSNSSGRDNNKDDQGDQYRGNNSKRNGRGRFKRPWNELFSKGDILVMTSNGSSGFSSQSFRRECLVIDVGDSWILAGVGKTWPMGVWDARKGFGSGKRSFPGDDSSYGYPVRLDKTPNAAALIPLRAQRSALQMVREHQEDKHPGAMMIATWLTKTTDEHCKGYYQFRNRKRWAKTVPSHFRQIMARDNGDKGKEDDNEQVSLDTCLNEAIDQVTKRRASSNFRNWAANANDSQREAIVWALSRRCRRFRVHLEPVRRVSLHF